METQALMDTFIGRQFHLHGHWRAQTEQCKVVQTQDSVPVAEICGLPHCSHQSVNSLRLPLVVNAHGLLHRHGDHLLKQVWRQRNINNWLKNTRQPEGAVDQIPSEVIHSLHNEYEVFFRQQFGWGPAKTKRVSHLNGIGRCCLTFNLFGWGFVFYTQT